MDDHGDINANPWDEWDKWLDFPTQDEPQNASETNVVGSGSADQSRNACKFIPETENTFTMGGGGVNIAITDLPAQFPGSQASVASDIVSNQLGNTVQHSIGISQGNKGVACYSPLSAGPGESLADVRVASNTLGLGENAPIGPYIMENASFIVQPVPWAQPLSNNALVHHPEGKYYINGSFGATILTGTGGPAERTNGEAVIVSLSLPSHQSTTYPPVNAVQLVPGAIPANGPGVTVDDLQRAIPQDGGHAEEGAIEGVYEGSPQPVASEASANTMNGVPPTTASPSRGPLLPVDPEGDKTRLKARLLKNGANVGAVRICDEIFSGGVTKEALQRPLTRDQCERLHLRDGKQFQRLLEKVEVTGETKNRCRLCPGNGAKLYKYHRDALRHFFKDHFGLWFECMHCGHKAFTQPELRRHVKISHGTM